MSKYIKLDDIKYRDVLYTFATNEELLVATEEDIESLPTIEIVRCKDCKYSNVYVLDSNEEPQRWCKVGLAKAVGDDDYCSWGE